MCLLISYHHILGTRIGVVLEESMQSSLSAAMSNIFSIISRPYFYNFVKNTVSRSWYFKMNDNDYFLFHKSLTKIFHYCFLVSAFIFAFYLILILKMIFINS